MDHKLDVAALAALGHPGRLAVFRLLARRAPHGVRPGEIAAALGFKPSTLSVHVSGLTDAGLLVTWREGRSVFYGIDLTRVGALVDFLVNDCCRGRPELCTPLAAHALARADGLTGNAREPRAVLFVCTANSARSVFAEAILNAAGSRFRAYSAGTRPAERINPRAKNVLRALGHDVEHLEPRPLTEFRRVDAPRIDLIITVCDQAANEECPPLPDLPLTAHWSLPDPVAVRGTDAEQDVAFQTAYRSLQRRIEQLVALPKGPLDPLLLQRRLDEIGGPPPPTTDRTSYTLLTNKSRGE